MIKYIIRTFVLILLGSTVLFGFLYFKERNIFDLYRIKHTQESNQLKAVGEGLRGLVLNSLVYNNTEISFPKVKKQADYTFCLFISENQCSTCVNAAVKYYLSNRKAIPDSNFLILANYNTNALRYLKAEHQLKCKIISTYGTNINIAENKSPCFFIYNKETAKTEMFLFPLKKESEMIKAYFEKIRDKYFI